MKLMLIIILTKYIKNTISIYNLKNIEKYILLVLILKYLHVFYTHSASQVTLTSFKCSVVTCGQWLLYWMEQITTECFAHVCSHLKACTLMYSYLCQYLSSGLGFSFLEA